MRVFARQTRESGWQAHNNKKESRNKKAGVVLQELGWDLIASDIELSG
jgi:hypothetical protein